MVNRLIESNINPLGVIIENVYSSVFCAVKRNKTSRYIPIKNLDTRSDVY